MPREKRDHHTQAVYLGSVKTKKDKSHEVISRVGKDTIKITKLPLATLEQITTDKKRISQGTKGAGSMRVIYPKTANKSKTTSYSVPIPSYFKVEDMYGVFNKCQGSPLGFVTPRGRFYPKVGTK